MAKVAAIQMVSGGAIGPNLMQAEWLIAKAVDKGAKMVLLPESFALMSHDRKDMLLITETIGKGRIQDFMAECAQKFKIWIVAGTIPTTSPEDHRAYATSVVYDHTGTMVDYYHKIHLFDVELPGGESHQESLTYYPGKEIKVVDSPFGGIGLSVCYDLRFPELYRQLRNQGADIIMVPSAFIEATGKVHWRTLLHARAIENQCYIVAANQGGVHENRVTYGHSTIVGPWGLTLDLHEKGPGFVMAHIDKIRVDVLREEFPVWEHKRLWQSKH